MAPRTELAAAPLLSVVILTMNEAANLPTCLASLRGMDVEVFVVDSGSSDTTVEIAQAAGATVVTHPFENQARQFNWALDNLELRSDWIMRLDADERVTPELARELRTALPQASVATAGFVLKRRVYFWGHWIRHGGYYPVWLMRVWRRGQGRCEDVAMDEHIEISGGATGKLQHDIIDENQKGLSFWIIKHDSYAAREVINNAAPAQASAQIGAQATRQRNLKIGLYGRAPLFWRAFLYWLFRYVLLLGFLDGTPGLVFHFLQGFWYRLLVDAKLYEARLTRQQQAEGGQGGA